MTAQRQQLIELIRPVITAAGYDLDELSVTAAGRRSLIRVSVDGDHGIDLDAVATISRTISDVLDDDSGTGASFAGPYVLEVSSPGVDRPLTQPKHWRRAIGRLVTIGVEGRQLTGRVLSVDDSTVVLDIAGTERSLPMAGLGPGRVQVEFSRPGEAPSDAGEADGADPNDNADLEDSVDLDDSADVDDGMNLDDDDDGEFDEFANEELEHQRNHTKEA
ncbi:ribosome maturation factor RimP [Jatrophihabitans sp.]|jgi:ribosome maturation factor RimP|uniref:ribosome maturation factor RimP n=1 Tax=Jatrophihabitans sp. TaxID=1932789 RepID=UPI002F24158F